MFGKFESCVPLTYSKRVEMNEQRHKRNSAHDCISDEAVTDKLLSMLRERAASMQASFTSTNKVPTPPGYHMLLNRFPLLVGIIAKTNETQHRDLRTDVGHPELLRQAS